jgi:hypothetical protein
MDTDSANTETTPLEAAAPAKTGRPPFKRVVTSAVKLILLQNEPKSVVRGKFEFRITRNGKIVITRSMADFQSFKSHIEIQNLSYHSFFPKFEKPIKEAIRHLPHNTPAEDISDGLVSLGLDDVSIKQMTATRRSPPEDSKFIYLPLFLINAVDSKVPESFRLSTL